MTWTQNYQPLGSLLLSALVASFPVVVLLALLGLFHVRAHLAALTGLVVAWLVAVVVYHMPWTMATAAAGYGAAFGLFPIGWIVLNAIFVYDLSVETGQFEALKKQIASIAADRGLQALLIAFSFGAFIEGAAGFGTPVAISAAMLIGLGFKPLDAARLALIGNTAPVAYGAIGTPLTTLAKLTGLDLHLLSAMVGRQLPFFSLLVPFWLIVVQGGLPKLRQIWPACLVTGASFGLTQFLVSNYHGPWLVDIVSSLVSMGSLVLFLRIWQPRPGPESESEATPAPVAETPAASPWKPWIPWIALTIFVGIWGIPAVKSGLDQIAVTQIPIPGLHEKVIKVAPVAPATHPEEKAILTMNWLSFAGTALLLAGLVSGLALGQTPAGMVRIYLKTFQRVQLSLWTISLMMALGFTTKYCGSDTTMGLAFASTGSWFPFFSPLLGWLGVALTGSDTSSNVLFGNLQVVTAKQLGLSPILTAAANSSGGVMGKMIDAQSIVVANVATGGRPDSPSVGTILRAVFFHSIVLAALVGVLIWLQSTILSGMVPQP